MKEYNGIKYRFTKKEVETVAEVLKIIRSTKNPEMMLKSKIISTAFNRPVLGELKSSQVDNKLKNKTMDIKKKLEDKKEMYKAKMNNLAQAEQMAMKIRTECVALEGQIEILEEILKDNKKTKK